MAWRLRACVARAVLRCVACAAGVSRRCGFSARWLTHGKLNCWRGAACRVVRCVCDAVSDGWHVSVAAPYISRMRRKRLEVDDGEWRCAAGHARAKAIAGRAGKWFLARKQARTPMRKARCISVASAGGRWRTMLDDGALDRGRLGAGFEPLAARARGAGGAAATRDGDRSTRWRAA